MIAMTYSEAKTVIASATKEAKRLSHTQTISPTFDGRTSRRLLFFAFSASLFSHPTAQAELPCRGLTGYELSQCLKEKRNSQKGDDVRGEYLKSRQFEQPGELVTLPNGLQYRELETGESGEAVRAGVMCSVSYIVYRLSSGAYYKYSSGGTPVYMFSRGYGFEGRDDLDSVYQFRYGDEKAVPLAVLGTMSGMKVGSRRRILVPPDLGWIDDTTGPRPDTFGGFRRLEAHKDEPLLFEVEVKRIQMPKDGDSTKEFKLPKNAVEPFSLPAPPKPTQR